MKKRLQKLCNLTEGDACADIGCDHGYLCEMMVEKGVKDIYACEVTEKNLMKAQKNITNYINRKCKNVVICNNQVTYEGGQVHFVLSNGFKNLQIIPKCVIIAGMGGELILNILLEDKLRLPEILILQPNTKIELVRSTLMQYYQIIEDKVLYDCGKYYNIIKAVKGNDTLTKLEILFGKTNLQTFHKDFIDYLQKMKYNAKKINTEYFKKLLIQIEKVEEMYEQNSRISKAGRRIN